MKRSTGLSIDGFRDYLFIETNQCRLLTPLCCVDTVGVGWGVNISNGSPEYIQPEREREMRETRERERER